MAKIMGAAAHLLRDMADFEAQLSKESRPVGAANELDAPASVIYVAPSKLSKNPYQARRLLLDEEVEDIAESLLATLENGHAIGILQPITVRVDPNDQTMYQIVSGEKRWRAAEMVALDTVPVIVREYSDRDMMIVGLVENVKRSNLAPVDLAMAAKRLKEDFSLTNIEVAALLNLGKSKSAYSMTVKILALPDNVLSFMNENSDYFSAKHGRVLLEQHIAKDQMLPLANKVVEQGWSARALEKHCLQLQLVAKEKPVAYHLNTRQKQTLRYLGDMFEQPITYRQKQGKHVLTLECETDTQLNELLNRFSSLASRSESMGDG